jgi:hypothetical protein
MTPSRLIITDYLGYSKESEESLDKQLSELFNK